MPLVKNAACDDKMRGVYFYHANAATSMCFFKRRENVQLYNTPHCNSAPLSLFISFTYADIVIFHGEMHRHTNHKEKGKKSSQVLFAMYCALTPHCSMVMHA